MSTAFDDVRLPEDIEQGALIGPSFQTTIVPLSSGAEQRNADWQQEKLIADISYGIMQRANPDDVSDSFAAVLHFYRARMGRHRSFRFRDWGDFEASAELMVRLSPHYALLVMNYDGYRRIITRPDPATLVIEGNPKFTLGYGGLVKFDDPQGQALQASFLFDIAMRFDSDIQQVNLTTLNAGEIPDVKLIQVPEPYDLSLVVADNA